MAAEPGRLELFCLLRREFDDALLQEMAGADGGMWQERYLRSLAEILRTGTVPSPLPPADPVEICHIVGCHTLELSTPLSPEERRRAIMRLFGAWILLNVYARPERYDNGQTEAGDELALQHLTQTSVALGPEFVRAAIRFVSWAQSAAAAAHGPI
ncbi:MAG TPA: hypothetical protein VNT26_24640, partial [Candidatus Sulfotelmatobacter sp.]|nr:hypothetical protein [Candidatus Sulfotelmatobacter sp.]